MSQNGTNEEQRLVDYFAGGKPAPEPSRGTTVGEFLKDFDLPPHDNVETCLDETDLSEADDGF